jgi:RNA polymerase sigma-70 factor, ECF subfamily
MNDLRFAAVCIVLSPSPLISETSLPYCEIFFSNRGNKSLGRRFTLVCVSEERLQSASFEELAMPLFDQLYNFAHWLTQNREEAEDLVQETFMKALRGFSSFQPGTNFRAWLYRILRNTFLTSRSGLQVTMTTPMEQESDSVVSNAPTPELLLLERADQEAVRSAIASLPVHSREIVLLCDMEEMSYQEIADTLGIPMGTVMSRLSRARKALRERLSAKTKNAARG